MAESAEGPQRDLRSARNVIHPRALIGWPSGGGGWSCLFPKDVHGSQVQAGKYAQREKEKGTRDAVTDDHV